MEFYTVVDLDEDKDKDTITKLKSAYEIIWDNVPINEHGRCDELLILIHPSNTEVVQDFKKCCEKAILRLRSGSKEIGTLNEAIQICQSILKQINQQTNNQI